MHENASYAAKHFWKTLVVVVVVVVVAFLMLFFNDALKKMCLLLPLSIESTLFFFS